MTNGSNVDREKELRSKMESAIHGMNGIFLGAQCAGGSKAAHDLVSARDRENGIASLIVAGEQLAQTTADQF